MVDDADVGRPGDSQWHVEVDDAGSKTVGRIQSFGVASKSLRPRIEVHVRPHEHRDIEARVADPNADDNGRCYSGFQSRSSHLLQS